MGTINLTSSARLVPASRTHRRVLVIVMAIAFLLHVWGIKRDLPFSPETDEGTFIIPAVRMATVGDLNPHWFGHPGSTVIYPLAGVYHLWSAIAFGGQLLRPNANLDKLYLAQPESFVWLGRLVSISYGVLSLLFVYLIGARLFDPWVGLCAAWFVSLAPIAVEQAQMVRSDSAAALFGGISLWLFLRLYDKSTLKHQMLAGIAAGAAIGTRYFMVALVPVLMLANLAIFRRSLGTYERRIALVGAGVGIACVGVGFVLSTPFFVLDLDTAIRNIRFEARSTHLGADNQTPPQNFVWYLTRALPASLTWAHVVLAAAGMVLVARRRMWQRLLLVVFAACFLGIISMSSLHWQRWIIQILPVGALFAAYALRTALREAAERPRWRWLAQPFSQMLVVLMLSVWPLYQVIIADIQQSNPSTRLIARDWVVRHMPAGSRIAQERYGVPLNKADFIDLVHHDRLTVSPDGIPITLLERYSLGTDRTLDSYKREGYSYLIVSSSMYERYMAEPARYTTEVAFYQSLFEEAELVQRFEPSLLRGGPVIQIYRLERDSTGALRRLDEEPRRAYKLRKL